MLKIYGIPVSVHTRKVIVAALAKGLSHEIIPVVPLIPDNPPANWRDLSPTGKIPALTDGDFTVSDSAAICDYLEHLQPQNPMYPQCGRDRAQVLSLEQYAGSLYRDVVHPLFIEVIVNPGLRNKPTDQGLVDRVLARAMPEAFGYLDGVIQGDYLVGDKMTIADISVMSNLVNYQYIGFELPRARFPRLAALFDRVVQQPAVQEALRCEQAAAESMGLKTGFLSAVLG